MVEIDAVTLFAGLNSQELADLHKIAQERRLPGGAQIFQEGDPGDGLYVIRNGSVQITHRGGMKIQHVFSTLKPGDIFGEMAVIEDRPRSATALALAEVELYFFPRAEMRGLLQHSPGLAFNTLNMVSQRLRDFNELHVRELIQTESLALIGRFAQSIVHDLKNPLSIIGLCAEMFDMPHISAETKAKTQARIRKQVDRVSDLVGDILIFSENTRHQHTRQPVNFRKFLEEMLPDLKTEVEIKSVRLVLEGTVPEAMVRLDARRLSRVFYNLTGNATDFTPEGGVIYVRCTLAGQEIITEMEDTGPGVAPEIASKLFQAFASHGKTHGTGLGLSICKKIIEDHGGRIWARSEPGRGAIFCFALPLAK